MNERVLSSEPGFTAELVSLPPGTLRLRINLELQTAGVKPDITVEYAGPMISESTSPGVAAGDQSAPTLDEIRSLLDAVGEVAIASGQQLLAKARQGAPLKIKREILEAWIPWNRTTIPR